MKQDAQDKKDEKKLKKYAHKKKMAEGKLRLRKHSTVRPQGGQRLSFQGTVACSAMVLRGFARRN